jgi:hypothetical protein
MPVAPGDPPEPTAASHPQSLPVLVCLSSYVLT